MTMPCGWFWVSDVEELKGHCSSWCNHGCWGEVCVYVYVWATGCLKRRRQPLASSFTSFLALLFLSSIHTHLWVGVCVCVYRCTCTYSHLHTYTHTQFINVCACPWVHMHLLTPKKHIYKHVLTCMYIHRIHLHIYSFNLQAPKPTHTHLYTQVSTYMPSSLHTRTHTYSYTYI